MSLWQDVGDWYDDTTENVTEWWAGEDEQKASEDSGIPNSEGGGTVTQPKAPMNWTAASVAVGALSIVVSLLK